MSERGGVHTFRATWTVKDPVTGRRVLKKAKTWSWRWTHKGHEEHGSGGYRTQAEARENGLERLAQYRSGIEKDPRKTTFADLERIGTAEMSVKAESTQVSSKNAWGHLREHLGGLLAIDVIRPRLLEYVEARRAQGAADATIKKELAHLRIAIRSAYDQRTIMFLPRFPSIRPNKRNRAFRPDELAALIEHSSRPDRNLWLATYMLSWRCYSEVVSRKRSDINWTGGKGGYLELDAASTKKRKARVFPITARLKEVLEDQQEYVAELERKLGKVIPWLFPSIRGDRLPQSTMGRRFKAACARAGLEKSVHDIRRTATRRHDAILSRSQAMGLSGHESEEAYSDYTRLDSHGLESIRALLNRADGETIDVSNVVGMFRDRK